MDILSQYMLSGLAYGASFQAAHPLLSLAPTVVLIATAPLYLHLCHEQAPTSQLSEIRQFVSILAASALVTIEAILLAPGSQAYGSHVNISIPASTISLVTSISVFFLLYLELRGLLRLSSLLSLYASLGLPLDAAKAWGYSSQSATIFGRHAVMVTAFKGLLLIASDILGHPVYVVLRAIILPVWDVLRFRNTKLGPEFSAEILSNTFSETWNRKTSSKNRLVKTILHVLNRPILSSFIPRLCFITLLTFQPWLAWKALFVTDGLSRRSSALQISIIQCLLVYIGIAVSRAVYLRHNDRLAIMLHSMLSAEVCKKALRIRNSRGNGTLFVQLLQSDIESIVTGFLSFLDVGAAIAQIIAPAHLLWKAVGPIASLVVISPIVSVVTYIFLDRQTASLASIWDQKGLNTVSRALEFMKQLKGLKLLNLESVVSKDISKFHESEMLAFSQYHFLGELPIIAEVFPENLAPVLLLAGIGTRHALKLLSPLAVFPILALVSLAMQPFQYLSKNLKQISSGLRSVQALQDFLLSDEVTDPSPSSDYQVRQNSPAPHEESTEASPQCSITTLSTNSWQVHGTRFHQSAEAAQLRMQAIVVRFTHATVTTLDGRISLTGVNITIKRSETTVVLGPPGSGKSALLGAIMGEVDITAGALHVVENTVAYCGQEPWIQDISIRDNIVGPAKFDKVWYDCVVDTCMLRLSINRLPGRDDFIAGINGANLDKDVQFRIALARCLYIKAPITLLDDVFSVLDGRTAKSIYKRLFDRSESGFFSQLGSAIVLTTTSVDNRLAANQLLLIDEHGNTVTQNSNSGAALNNNYINLLRRSPNNEIVADQTLDESESLEIDLASGKEVAKEELSLYSAYFKSLPRKLLMRMLLLIIALAVTANFPQLYLRLWADINPSSSHFLATYTLSTIFSSSLHIYLAKFFNSDAVVPASTNFYRLLLETISGTTLPLLTSRRLRTGFNGASKDIKTIGNSMPFSMLRLVSSSLLLFADSVVILLAARQYAIPFLFMFGAFYFALRYIRSTLREAEYQVRGTKASIVNYCTETAHGSEYIRGFGWQPSSITTAFTLLGHLQTQMNEKLTAERHSKLVADLLSLVGALTVVATVSIVGHTSQGSMGMSLVLLVTYGNSVMRFAETLCLYDSDLEAVGRLRKFIERTPIEERIPDIKLPSKWPGRGDIELIDVTARYRGSPNSAPALDDISMKVDPGQKVGITGPGRSGKSSLFLTILGFLDYTGTIIIDGVDISTIPRHELRTRITTVTNHDIKLGGSVRDSLLPFAGQQDDVTINDWLLYEALDQVGLWEIVQAAGGYGAPVSKLSLNRQQRHLLCIARAMMQRLHTQSRLVLMDEPTTQLDSETAALAQDVMEEAFLESTVLTAAESENSLPVVDMLLGLEDGGIEFVD